MKQQTLQNLKRPVIRLAMAGGLVLLLGLSFADDMRDWVRDRQTENTLSGFADLCLERFPALTETDKIKSLRHCVHIYSTYNDDPENKPYWRDPLLMARWMDDFARGKRSDAPPMECFFRSHTLKDILETRSIEASTLSLVKTSKKTFSGHVVNTILNPDTGKWEVHDAFYDVDFIDPRTKAGMTLPDMLSYEFADYAPCTFEGKCDWSGSTREDIPYKKNQTFWNAAYNHKDKTLYVADKRFSVKETRSIDDKPMTVCERREGWCDKVVVIPPRK